MIIIHIFHALWGLGKISLCKRQTKSFSNNPLCMLANTSRVIAHITDLLQKISAANPQENLHKEYTDFPTENRQTSKIKKYSIFTSTGTLVAMHPWFPVGLCTPSL